MQTILPLLTTAVLMLGLAAPQAAQSGPPGVPDGTSYWSLGGDLVSVQVTENPDPTPGNYWVQSVDQSGFSSVANGVGADGVTRSDEFSTGGATYKIMGGKVFKKTSRGKWALMKKVKAPRKGPRGGGSMSIVVIIGDEVVSLPQ